MRQTNVAKLVVNIVVYSYVDRGWRRVDGLKQECPGMATKYK